MSKCTILHGNNIELLKQFPDNYFASIVTDSPYGLGKEPNAVKCLSDWLEKGYHEVKGKGFMGNNWDAFVPQPILWKECFRVLKPGGYLLSFFGTRTYDWGTLAIRLAGFEIRDMISWIYGSGFPKSLDISKAIEGTLLNGTSNKKDFSKLNGERLERGNWGITKFTKEQGFRKKDYTHETSQSDRIGKLQPTTDEAKQWEGYGTALKPACEPICVARKPLTGTVAENVLKWGTGGLNIDGCRIPFDSDKDLKSATFGRGTNIIGGNYVGAKHTDGRKNIEANPTGRFPSNVILDPESATELDRQTGQLSSGTPSGTKAGNNNNIYGQFAGGMPVTGYGDTGGASRFFYCAKASQDERNAGLEELQSEKVNDGRKTEIDNPFQRGETLRKNTHPTVKPIALMRYLIRMVTPQGETSLDLFAGSGTTGCAAELEGIDIVLMEAEEQYIPIIQARTAYWRKIAEEETRKVNLQKSQMSIFDVIGERSAS